MYVDVKFEINDKPLSLTKSSAFRAPLSSYGIVDTMARMCFFLHLEFEEFHSDPSHFRTSGKWGADTSQVCRWLCRSLGLIPLPDDSPDPMPGDLEPAA